MFVASLKNCRNVVNQSSLKLISKNITTLTAELRCKSQMITSNLVNDKETADLFNGTDDKNIMNAVKLINQYSSPEAVQWKKLHEELNRSKIKNYRLVILQACLRLNSSKVGISYVDHILKSREEQPLHELVLFLRSFLKKKDEVMKYKELVKYVYDNVKEYIRSSSVLQSYVIGTVAEIPSCFYDLVKNFPEDELLNGREILVKKALELKNPEVAHEIMNYKSCRISSEIFEAYINFLCEMVKEKKFSPQMITSFVEVCENKINIIGHQQFLPLIRNFVELLRSHDENYQWTVRKCVISEDNVCSRCNMKLVDKCISDSEFDTLRNEFLPSAGLLDKSIFLSTSNIEMRRFFKFLKTCEHYDIVFDGLNMMYQSKNFRSKVPLLLKYFFDKGMSMLIISRKHARQKVSSIPLLIPPHYRNQCQFFFTDNLSDDDVFVLYAALHRGPKTFVLSGDFLQSYIARFSDDLQKLFLKWKLYHQYISKDIFIYPPRPSLGLSQFTADENGERLTWHISNIYEETSNVRLNSTTPIDWVCLQAQKRNCTTALN